MESTRADQEAKCPDGHVVEEMRGDGSWPLAVTKVTGGTLQGLDILVSWIKAERA